MRKIFLLITLCFGATNLLYAQGPLKDDTIKFPLGPPYRPLNLFNNNTINFTAVNSSLYSFSIEKNGEEIFNDEVSLSAGDNYVIDLSSYPAGTYQLIIRDIIYSKEYEYFFTKQEDDFELL